MTFTNREEINPSHADPAGPGPDLALDPAVEPRCKKKSGQGRPRAEWSCRRSCATRALPVRSTCGSLYFRGSSNGSML